MFRFAICVITLLGCSAVSEGFRMKKKSTLNSVSEKNAESLVKEDLPAISSVRRVEIRGFTTCGWYQRAVRLAEQLKLKHPSIDVQLLGAPSRSQYKAWLAAEAANYGPRASTWRTSPFVVLDGTFIGGHDDFSRFVSHNSLLQESQLNSATCPPSGFDTQGALEGGLDLEWYASGKWYVQQQMPISYLPEARFFCVTAEYKLLDKKTFWGYDVEVTNFAASYVRKVSGGPGLCAKIVDRNAGKLSVAPCFLPSFAAGDYWIVAFSKEEGWALISGGPPKETGSNGCKTGTGVNGSGLWIFTREQLASQDVVEKVRGIAEAKGFDLSVLKPVNQTGCIN